MFTFKTLAVISVTASYLRGGGFSGWIGFVGAASVASVEEAVAGSNESGLRGLNLDQDALDGFKAGEEQLDLKDREVSEFDVVPTRKFADRALNEVSVQEADITYSGDAASLAEKLESHSVRESSSPKLSYDPSDGTTVFTDPVQHEETIHGQDVIHPIDFESSSVNTSSDPAAPLAEELASNSARESSDTKLLHDPSDGDDITALADLVKQEEAIVQDFEDDQVPKLTPFITEPERTSSDIVLTSSSGHSKAKEHTNQNAGALVATSKNIVTKKLSTKSNRQSALQNTPTSLGFHTHIGTEGNTSVVVKDQEEEEIVFVLSVIALVKLTAVGADLLFNDGEIVRYVGEEILKPALEKALGYLSWIVDEGLKRIFTEITTFIYNELRLESYDGWVKKIVNKGLRNFLQFVEEFMEPFIKLCKKLLERVKPLTDALLEGLENIGILEQTKQITSSGNTELHYLTSSLVGLDGSVKSNGDDDDDPTPMNPAGLLLLVKNMGEKDDVYPKVMAMMSAVHQLQTDIDGENTPSDVMNDVLDKLQYLILEPHLGMKSFLEEIDGVGSLQFMITMGVSGQFFGLGGEIGVSISCKHLLNFIVNRQWSAESRTLMTIHVGYDISFGFQENEKVRVQTASDNSKTKISKGDVFVGYHTSDPVGTNGFGWGFGVDVPGMGMELSWPLPGAHIPNQFVYNLGHPLKPKCVFGFNHAIIVGYYDLDYGFLLATPSTKTARATGNPSRYYKKYDWEAMGWDGATAAWEKLGWDECSWDDNRISSFALMNSFVDCASFTGLCPKTPKPTAEPCSNGPFPPPPSHDKEWRDLSDQEQEAAGALGFVEKSWNAPLASDGWGFDDPLVHFRAPRSLRSSLRNSTLDSFLDLGASVTKWDDLLDDERDYFACLGFNKYAWDGNTFNSQPVPSTWNDDWDELSSEMVLCATAVGYDKRRWNDKPTGSRVKCTKEGSSCNPNGDEKYCCKGGLAACIDKLQGTDTTDTDYECIDCPPGETFLIHEGRCSSNTTPSPTPPPTPKPTMHETDYLGLGQCRDDRNRPYAYVMSDVSRTKLDCNQWCFGKEKNLNLAVGYEEFNFWFRSAKIYQCRCLYSGGLPKYSSHVKDFSPYAYKRRHYKSGNGLGPIKRARNYSWMKTKNIPTFGKVKTEYKCYKIEDPPTKTWTQRPTEKPTPKPTTKADKLRDATHSIKIDLAQDISSKCLDQIYDVALKAIDDDGVHFLLTATASNSVSVPSDKCPEILAFASIESKKVTYMSLHGFGDYNSHWLGTASLKDIIEAESSVDPVDDSEYDLTHNSCAHYAQAIWRKLKFEETHDLADFLIENLLHNDGLLALAHQKVAVGGLRVLSKFKSDEDLFKKYIKETVNSQLNIK